MAFSWICRKNKNAPKRPWFFGGAKHSACANPKLAPLQPSDSYLVARCVGRDSYPDFSAGCTLLASCSALVFVTVSESIRVLPQSTYLQ